MSHTPRQTAWLGIYNTLLHAHMRCTRSYKHKTARKFVDAMQAMQAILQDDKFQSGSSGAKDVLITAERLLEYRKKEIMETSRKFAEDVAL